MAGFTTRSVKEKPPLRAVPNQSPMERYWEGFNRVIQGIQIDSGIAIEQRNVARLLSEANRAGLEHKAACLENALEMLRAAEKER